MKPLVFRPSIKAVFLALAVACAITACSTPNNSCEAGQCDAIVADAPRPPSRCYTAELPACDRGADLYSDEACFAWEDVETRTPPTANAMKAPTVTEPMDMAVLPAATPATFRWTGNLVRNQQLPPWLRRNGVVPTPGALRWQDELRKMFTLLPEAHAHCAPFSGVAYGLDFYSNNVRVIRAELSATMYQPNAAAWALLRAATGTIELRMTVVRMRANEVTEGPYSTPTATRFTIAAQ